jgi:ribosomal protein S19E (S16A)
MAPTKRKRATEPFVRAPLWWIEAVAKATRTPAMLVCIELLRASWKAKSSTFPLPNARFKKLGVSRDVKRRILHDLESAGLILVKRPPRKTPVITLVAL